MRVVFVTCAPDEAEGLLRQLLQERLVGCGNILSGVRSLYWWQGEVCDDRESILLMETSAELAPALVARVKALHSYDTPKVVCFEVREREPDYEAWLRGVLQGA